MALSKELRKHVRQVIGPALAVTLFAYFAYHAVEGDRGLLAWVKLSQEVDATQAQLTKITGIRERLEHETSLLRSQALDPDMLDERARAQLGVVRSDEMILVVPAEQEHRSDAAPASGRLLALVIGDRE
jgi:cell division protein FtsB